MTNLRPAVPRTLAPVSGSANVQQSTPQVEVRSAPTSDEAGGTWPDEAAETSFLSEARDRGESIPPASRQQETADVNDAKAMPPLDELVTRIPPEVRETLEDLFRAKFTTVRRVPSKALKTDSGQ